MTVLVGMALAAAVLVSANGVGPSSPARQAESGEAITAIRSGLEPAAFLAKHDSRIRISGKHREGSGRDRFALGVLATAAVLALCHVVTAGQAWPGPTLRVRRAWAQRAPPLFRLT